MGRRWVRVVATGGAALVIVGALGAWRLGRGPVDLGFLTPRLEAALGAPDGSFRIAIGATRLEWDGRDRDVDVRLLDVRAHGRDGALLATLPALAVRPSLAALVRGTVAPVAIDVLGARLRLGRSAEPGIDLDVGEGAKAGGDSIAARLLDGMAGRAPAGPTTASLERLAVRDATVVLADPTGADLAVLEGLDLRFRREPGGVALALVAEAVAGGRRVPLRAAGLHHAAGGRTEIRLEFSDLEPRALATVARTNPALASLLARVGVALTGSLTLDLDPTLTPRHARLRAESGPGVLALADPWSGDAAIRSLHLVATADAAEDRLAVERLAVDLGGPELVVHGTVDGLSPPRAVDAGATLTELPTGALATWWPARAAPEARAWVTTRIRDGRVRRASATLALRRGDAGFRLDRLDGTVLFDGLAVRWLDGMPPATAVSGRGTFTAHAWSFQVARGRVAGLAIVGAEVKLDGLAAPPPPVVRGRTAPRGPKLAVVARANGPLSAALTVLDGPPFGAARALGVVPSEVGGTADGRVAVAFPLAAPSFDLRATARLRDVRVPRIGPGWPLDGGDLGLTYAANRLDVAGTARVAGAPLTIGWREDLAARTRKIDVRGRVGAAERAGLGFDLRPTLDGPVDVDASLAGTPGGRSTLTLALDLAPAVVDAPVLAIVKPAGQPGRASGRFTLDGAALAAADDVRLDVDGTALRAGATRTADRRRWRTIDADATLRPRVRGMPPGHVTLDVRPLPGGNTIALRADDAGAVLRAIDPTIEVARGRLAYTATGDLAAPGLPIDGALDVRDFTVTRSPLLARLATLGSFSGIRDALAGRGVVFDELTARISHRDATITIADGRVTGPSVALTAAGTVDRGAGTIALRGTVVPSYLGLNRAAGRIPVVGRLAAGADKEGIQAFDFEVRGPLAKPQVRVDKLASLAPGALRDLFRRLPR